MEAFLDLDGSGRDAGLAENFTLAMGGDKDKDKSSQSHSLKIRKPFSN